MDSKAVASIIRDLAEYLRANPSQLYQVSVSMTGFQSHTSGAGATGVRINAVGGAGPGPVIGARFEAQFGDAEVEVARLAADEAFTKEIGLATEILNQLADEIERPRPDEVGISGMLDRLKGFAISGVIGEVAGLLLRHGLRLPL